MNLMQRTMIIGGREVRVGEQWPQRLPGMSFELTVRCVSVQPERYVGVISFDGERLLETTPVTDFDKAVTDARTALRKRVRAAITES